MTSSGPSHVSPGEPVLAETVNWLIDAAQPYMSAPGEWRMTDNTRVFGPETDELFPTAPVAVSKTPPRCWEPVFSRVKDMSGKTTVKVTGAKDCMVSWGRRVYGFGNLSSTVPLSGDVYAVFTRTGSADSLPKVELSSGNFFTKDGVLGLLSEDTFKMPLWRVGKDGSSVTLDCRGIPFMPVYN